MSLAARALNEHPPDEGTTVADQEAAFRYIRQHDARAVQLDRMSRGDLAAIYRQHHPGGWTAAQLAAWTGDELVNGILEVEFPRRAAALAVLRRGISDAR